MCFILGPERKQVGLELYGKVICQEVTEAGPCKPWERIKFLWQVLLSSLRGIEAKSIIFKETLFWQVCSYS